MFENYAIDYGKTKLSNVSPNCKVGLNLVNDVNLYSSLVYDRLQVLDSACTALNLILYDVSDGQMFEENGSYKSRRVSIDTESAKIIVGTLYKLSSNSTLTVTYLGHPIVLNFYETPYTTVNFDKGGVDVKISNVRVSARALSQSRPEPGHHPVYRNTEFPFIVIDEDNNESFIYDVLPLFKTIHPRIINDDDSLLLNAEAVPVSLLIRSLMNQATEFDFSYNILVDFFNDNFNPSALVTQASATYGTVSSDVKELSDLIKASYGSSGVHGVIATIKERMFCSDAGELSDEGLYFTFSNNDNIKTESFLTGILSGLVSTVAEIIGAVVALSGQIIGVAIGALGSIIGSISKIINTNVDELTLTKFHGDASLSCCPIGYTQVSANSSYFSELATFFRTNGPRIYDFGFFQIFCGALREGGMGLEIHLVPRLIDVPTILKDLYAEGVSIPCFSLTSDHAESNPDFTNNVRGVYMSPSLSDFETFYTNMLEITPQDFQLLAATRSAEDFDFLVRRACSISLIMLFMAYMLTAKTLTRISGRLVDYTAWTLGHVGEDDAISRINSRDAGVLMQAYGVVRLGNAYSWNDLTHQSRGAALLQLNNANTNPSGTPNYYQQARLNTFSDYGEEYTDLFDDEKVVFYTYAPSFTSIPADSWISASSIFGTAFLMQLNDMESYSDQLYLYSDGNNNVVTSQYYCSLLYANGYAYDVPKYDRGSFWTSVIVAGIATAAISAAAVVVFVKARKALRRRNAANNQKCEAAWTAYSNDPSTENLETYERCVMKNNMMASFTGGTKYSKSGFWSEYGSSDNGEGIFSKLSSAVSSKLNTKENEQISEEVSRINIDFDSVKRLITG